MIAYDHSMAKNTIGSAPFSPVVILDKNGPLTALDLQGIIRKRVDGLSVCLRYENGPAKRGGYFFHIIPPAESSRFYTLIDFERKQLASFEFESLLRFVNHCTGRAFDQKSFDLCATELNFPRGD